MDPIWAHKRRIMARQRDIKRQASVSKFIKSMSEPQSKNCNLLPYRSRESWQRQTLPIKATRNTFILNCKRFPDPGLYWKPRLAYTKHFSNVFEELKGS